MESCELVSAPSSGQSGKSGTAETWGSLIDRHASGIALAPEFHVETLTTIDLVSIKITARLLEYYL